MPSCRAPAAVNWVTVSVAMVHLGQAGCGEVDKSVNNVSPTAIRYNISLGSVPPWCYTPKIQDTYYPQKLFTNLRYSFMTFMMSYKLLQSYLLFHIFL